MRVKVLSPSLGVWKREEEPTEHLVLKGFDFRTSKGLGETETSLLEGTYKVSCTPGARGKSSDLTRA